MGIFKLPKSLCDDINSTLAKYWWGQTKDEKKIHWINWNKLCRPKNNGGMGFRDIHAFNLAMLAKQAWRLIKHTHSLFYKVYKARYFPNSTFMEAELGTNPSYVWWSLLTAREIIRKGTRWRVGDGRHIQVAAHKWLNHDPIFLGSPPNSLFVSDLIDEDTRQWYRGKIQALFAPSTQKEILAIPLNNLHSSDELVWKENSTQNFTVKTAYKIALGLKNQPQGEHSQARQNGRIWKVWKLNVPPRFGPFCGEPVQIFCPQKTICNAGRWGSTTDANFAPNTLRPLVMCFGNALSLEMSGHWQVDEFRSVRIVHQISLSCSGPWQLGWTSRNLSCGQWSFGLSGMHVTNINLRRPKSSHSASMRVPWVS